MKRRYEVALLALTLGVCTHGLVGCDDQPCDLDTGVCELPPEPAWHLMKSLHMVAQRFYPDEDAQPEEGDERIRVTVTCGGETVVTEGDLVPQRGGGALIDLPDIPLPVDAGLCTVSACIIGEDGECVPYCDEGEQDVVVRPGVNEPVHMDLLCVGPFPGGVNVRIGVIHVQPSDPVYQPAKDIRACGGFTDLQFGFDVPPPADAAYRFDLRVSDPIYADRVRIVAQPGDRFRIIGLAHGERSDRLSEDGFVPLRATLDVNGATSTYDTHVYVRGDGDCRCRDGHPGLAATETRGTVDAARCAVDGRRLILESEALGLDDWGSCRARLAELLDISGLFGEAAGEARLQVEVCNDGPVEEWVTLLLYSSFQPAGDRERASLLLSAGPDSCEVHTVSQADFELDPASVGQFDPADINRVELLRGGVAGVARLSVRLDMDCCGGGGLCCAPGAVETCDGLDDDCDGEIDEGFDVGHACSSGEGVCRRMGRLRCEAGVALCSAQAGDAAPEDCNGRDDDCDGAVDEDFPCGLPCQAGTGECARQGLLVCSPDGAGAVCSSVPGDPRPEICNGLDDDCDGVQDEGVHNACGACGAVPSEVCNGLDDDCDGVQDEGVRNVCGGCGAVPPEVCNGLDDDCDGAADEGVVGGAEIACNGVDDNCNGRVDEGAEGTPCGDGMFYDRDCNCVRNDFPDQNWFNGYSCGGVQDGWDDGEHNRIAVGPYTDFECGVICTTRGVECCSQRAGNCYAGSARYWWSWPARTGWHAAKRGGGRPNDIRN